MSNSLDQIATNGELADSQHPAIKFLRLLGKDPATTYFRTFKAGKPNVVRNGRDLHGFDEAVLRAENEAGCPIYFVTGDADDANPATGCVRDRDVTRCPALFVEWDDRSIEWQIIAWRELGLPEPSVMVTTGGKSVHCYWVLTVPMTPAEWRVLQKRLTDHAGGDKNCKNPSRLMRLPGFRYVDKATAMVTERTAEVIHQSEVTYSVAEIEACLPALKRALTPNVQVTTDLHPRGIQAIRDAVDLFPQRSPQTYEQYRNAICGCAAALAEINYPDPNGEAIRLMAHLWEHGERQARQILESATTRNAASFWAIAGSYGFDLRRRATTSEKRKNLNAGEVMATLPQRVGIYRLNDRTRQIHAGRDVISGNALSRLYLSLSTPTETWPKEATYDAAIQLAQQHSFDPIAEYLRTNHADPLPLEHWQHLDQYLLGIDDSVAASFFPRYLMAAVARTLEPGCDFRQLPVLVGPQWIGKTALGRILFGADYFISGVGDLGRDSLMRCHNGWGVELAELDGITRRADCEELKQFISETSDVFRCPYDKATERWPRRFLFWGTSNGAAHRDITGSSRYVYIAVQKMLPLDRVEKTRDALWRRALMQYEQGDCWMQCDQESRDAIFQRNENYSEEDPWLQAVSEFLELRRKTQELPVRISDILHKLDVPQERQSNQMSSRVSRLAVSLGWEVDRRTFNGRRVKGLWPPGTPVIPMALQADYAATSSQGCDHRENMCSATPGTSVSEDVVNRGVDWQDPPPGTPADTFDSHAVAGLPLEQKHSLCSRSELLAWSDRGHASPDSGMAVIGSGADAFDDGDDPAWGPRPEAA